MPILGKRRRSRGTQTKRRRRAWTGVRRSFTRRLSPRFHSFKRTVNSANISVDSTAWQYGALNFQLANLPNYTEFTNLYDQYRICGIKVEFRPRVTGNDANAMATLVQFGDLCTVIDRNDNTAPTTQNELYQYSTLRTTRMIRGQKRYFVPACLVQTYETAVTAGYASKFKQWLDTNDYAVPHYGLKYAIAPSSSATAVTIGVIVTYYFQCKDIK